MALLYCLHFALYREMNKNQGLELVLVLSFAVVRLILTLLTVDTNPGRPGPTCHVLSTSGRSEACNQRSTVIQFGDYPESCHVLIDHKYLQHQSEQQSTYFVIMNFALLDEDTEQGNKEH